MPRILPDMAARGYTLVTVRRLGTSGPDQSHLVRRWVRTSSLPPEMPVNALVHNGIPVVHNGQYITI